jgi:hypothetical protein
VFNDELSGEEIKLTYLPVLNLSDTNTEPLPETTIDLHVPLGGHVSVRLPFQAPLVTRCTTLEAMITLWKGGHERYRETLEYVVNPIGAGMATVDFVGTDTTTRGDWVDSSGNRVFGQEAFLLPQRTGRTQYQEPTISLRRASAILRGDSRAAELQDNNSDSVVVWDQKKTAEDPRVPWSDVGRSTREPVAFAGRDHQMFFRVDCTDTSPHQVSLYLLDYKRAALPIDIDIYDTQGHRLDSRMVTGDLIDAGVYEKYRITGSVYIVLEALSPVDVAASGLFVDPIQNR